MNLFKNKLNKTSAWADKALNNTLVTVVVVIAALPFELLIIILISLSRKIGQFFNHKKA